MRYADQATAPAPAKPQGHPLYATDRSTVDRLLTSPTPLAEDIADASRLLIRYDNYPGCQDIQSDLHAALRNWGITRSELNDSARSLWRSGWRPTAFQTAESVGSGADVSAE